MTSHYRAALVLSTITLAGLAIAPTALAETAAHACGPNLIKNGSFEQGAAVGTWTTVEAGSSSIDAWTVTSGSVDIVGSLWRAANRARSIDMDGVSFGAISQSFASEPDKTYVVTFDLSGNAYGPPTVKKLQVSAAGQSAQYAYDLTKKPASNYGWSTLTWRFDAKAKSTTLSFASLDRENGYFGPVIDDIRVQATCD